MTAWHRPQGCRTANKVQPELAQDKQDGFSVGEDHLVEPPKVDRASRKSVTLQSFTPSQRDTLLLANAAKR
jgi:hypothetical protein